MAFAVKSFPSRALSDYKAIRSEIKSGDLLFCSGSAVFSKLIQRATGSCWSHVAFVMRLDDIDRVMVLESVESVGVRVIPLSRYFNDYSDGEPYKGGVVLARHQGFEQRINRRLLAKLGQFAADQFGYSYDHDEIAKISARIVQDILPFTRKEKTALKPDKEYICSEYVWSCYNQIGIKIKHSKADYVSPADFAKDPQMKLCHVLQRAK